MKEILKLIRSAPLADALGLPADKNRPAKLKARAECNFGRSVYRFEREITIAHLEKIIKAAQSAIDQIKDADKA